MQYASMRPATSATLATGGCETDCMTLLMTDIVATVECAAKDTDVAVVRYVRFVYWSSDMTYASSVKNA